MEAKPDGSLQVRKTRELQAALLRVEKAARKSGRVLERRNGKVVISRLIIVALNALADDMDRQSKES